MDNAAVNLLDGVDHGQAHVNTEDGVVGSFNRGSADAVVAVAEDLDAHLVVPLHPSKSKRQTFIT